MKYKILVMSSAQLAVPIIMMFCVKYHSILGRLCKLRLQVMSGRLREKLQVIDN